MTPLSCFKVGGKNVNDKNEVAANDENVLLVFSAHQLPL